MKQLQQIVGLVSQLIVENVQVDLAPQGDEGITVAKKVSRFVARTQSEEGITLEDVQAGVQDLTLPSRENPAVGATVRLDHMNVRIAPSFFVRAVPIAKEKLVGRLGMLVDEVRIRGQKVKVSLDADKKLTTEIWLERLEVVLGGRVGVTVSDVHIVHEGLALKEKNKKAALKASRAIIYGLEVRISEEFLNRAVDTARPKIPPIVQNVDFDLGSNRMLVTAKAKVFPMAIPVELLFSTENNLFGIYLSKVAVPFAAPVVRKAVSLVASKLPQEVKLNGDLIYIDPYRKIPVPLVCNVNRFTIEDRHIVLKFTAPANVPAPAPPAAVPPSMDEAWSEEEPAVATAAATLPPLP